MKPALFFFTMNVWPQRISLLGTDSAAALIRAKALTGLPTDAFEPLQHILTRKKSK